MILMSGSYKIVKETKQDKSKNPDSRYRNLKILSGSDGKSFYETRRNIDIRESTNDFVHEVSLGEEGRLDLIAYRYYKNPTLWWVIAYFNNILDPFEIPAGMVLKIPSKESIYGYGGILY